MALFQYPFESILNLKVLGWVTIFDIFSYVKDLSDETRQKISMSLKGKRSGKNSATAKRVLCQENGKVYDTIKLAAIELSVDASSIGKCCKGIYESIKGYHFSFVNEGS